jgi:hypothetical protein
MPPEIVSFIEVKGETNMRDKKKTAGLVGAGALAILMSTAAFAQPATRGYDRTQSDQSNHAARVGDRNGQYGGGQGNRGQNGGQDRGQYNRGQYNNGQDNRDQYNRGGFNRTQNNRGYGSRQQRQQYVSGIVQRFNPRSGLLTLRDGSSRRTITIDTSGMRMRNLRRGDYITVSGQWQGGNVFTAYSIGGGRY